MRPIRVYLLVIVLGAMLPGLLLTSVVVWRAFTTNRATSERRLLETARVDALAVDREFNNIVAILQALASSPTLDRDDLAAFHQEGRRLQVSQHGWYSVVLSSLDGKQLVSTRAEFGTPLMPISEPESLQRLKDSRQPVIGFIRPPARGGPEHLFPIRVPVIRDGVVKYALGAIVDVDSLTRLLPSQVPESEEWTRVILDPEGTIAVRTRAGEEYVGTQATDAFRERLRSAPDSVSSETTREGDPVYAATSRGAYGWTAVVVVPRAVLDAPLRASMAGILTGGVVLMVCGLVAVLVVSRRLSADLVARADAARAEAEDANRTKDAFLAVLGHELRNPLAPALTALELMRAKDPAAFKREREVLERQIAHMSRLVNDLLDVSRLARGKVQLDRRRFEVREAVDRAVDMATPLITQNRHTLGVSVPATGLIVDADIDRIVQVLSNLLTNAAKYTPPGGEIALTASADAGLVTITCDDNGPGVPEDLRATLFQPFAQGPRALDRREGGLGLGLALARIFTELHGGTIRLESRPKGGSRFVMSLPKAEAPAAAPPEQPARPAVAAVAYRVLVVDDNIDACQMLQVALGEAGHTTAIASSGPDALRVANEFRPQVAVLDIGLPGMDGYELARQLRATHPGIRLIALTGYSQLADVEAAVHAGFDAHCAKPITTTALLACIDPRSIL